MLTDRVPDAVKFRNSILASVRPQIQAIPKSPSTAYVWPTEFCSIGCAHCNFGAKTTGPSLKRYLSNYPHPLVRWLAEAGAQKIVVCGGGEPLDEPEFVSQALKECSKT